MLTPASILQQYWGYDSFRPAQETIIQSVLNKKDTLALFPTGGGKSICYQVPALLQPGVCLVVSPLIALMKDQVSNLQKKNIAAVALHSGLSYYELIEIFKKAAADQFKFLYVSPERLASSLFKEFAPALSINLIAVDEAHCISQWGYDFRPSYLNIQQLKKYTDAPFIALTASATPHVQKDIIEKLQLVQPCVFRQAFERPNISYSVFRVDSKINKLVNILNKVSGSAIVYCKNRKRTKETTQLLQLQNIAADFYHAGLLQEERDKKQTAWINNRTRVIVCTNAFGMGIDKPDVRTVIHLDAPDCIENYYQEAGRAGRDGKRAYAVLLYQPNDIQDMENQIAIKYPAIETLLIVYQAIADYLHIPVGAGEGLYYDFDLKEFSQNFSFNQVLVLNVLKTLEQQGFINFTENLFFPSKLGFTGTREDIITFENDYPELESIIKTLLRTYQGIFDNPVSISEKQLAKLCRLPIDIIKQQLQKIQSFGLITYTPQKETPQLYFNYNRAPAKYLHIDVLLYEQYKLNYQQKMQQLIQYIGTANCRSQTIAQYFGESNNQNCGVCDNCLQLKSQPLTTGEFTAITTQLLQLLTTPQSLQQIYTSLSFYRKEKLIQVIHYLQQEEKIITKNKQYVLKSVNN